jgi:hypothetical protein
VSESIAPIQLALQRHWIPVEQQSPPQGNMIWVTFRGAYDDRLYVVAGVYSLSDGLFRRESSGIKYQSSDWIPLAWMPKWAPKPYQP